MVITAMARSCSTLSHTAYQTAKGAGVVFLAASVHQPLPTECRHREWTPVKEFGEDTVQYSDCGRGSQTAALASKQRAHEDVRWA